MAPNRDAWAAFSLVLRCRHNAMGYPTLPNWSDIRVVLELHDLWTVEIFQKLDLCFTELILTEAESRKLNAASPH